MSEHPHTASPRALRGRPPTRSTEDLRHAALDILTRDGYTDATMKQLADELGVSLRTLHRHFPSKTDIAWGVLEGSIDQLKDKLASSLPDTDLHEAMQEAIIALVSAHNDETSTATGWIQLVGSTPELRAATSQAQDAWRRELAAFAMARMPSPDELAARSLAAGVQTATLEAISWWAEHPDAGSLADAIRRAVQALR